MKRVLKKLIAVICLVSVVSTAFVVPIVSTSVTVHAEPVSISMGLFEQVFNTIAGSFGMRSTKESKYYGFPSIEELFNSFKETYKMVQQTQPIPLALTVDAWVCSSLKDFTEGAIKVFPFFMQDIADGKFDGVMVGDDAPSEAKEKFTSFVNSINKTVTLEHQGNLSQRCHFYAAKQEEPTLDDSTYWGFGSWSDEISTLENHFSNVDVGYFFQNTFYVGIKTVAINNGEYGFFYYDNVNKTLVGYSTSGHVYQFDHLTYNGQDQGSYNFHDLEADLKVGRLSDKAKFHYEDIWTNMSIKAYADGSTLLYDPAYVMTKATFDTITDSLWNQIALPGANVDDWQLADENGKTIDDPESKILEKIYKNMLTADDIEALRNGDTSVLDKLDGMTAVNSKTGETVGDIKDEVQDQTGILGAIRVIGRTIASRVLTIVNLIRNLHQRKWISVIDNVGDLTLPVIKSIDGVRDVVNALQATKWVIDNVGDLVNPITTSIDMVNGNVAGVISNVGNAILGAIDDIQTADLTSVVDGIKAVPKSIAQSLESAFEGVKSSVGAVSVAIGNLFAPPPVALSNIYTKGSDILDNHFCMPKAAFKTFMVEGKEVPDVKYKVGGEEYIVIPFSYFNKFVDKFRVYIQASFIFIWIVWFANQVLALFDKSAILSGHITDLGRGER